MQPLADALDRLDQSWGNVSHLNAVLNSPELREAYPVVPIADRHALSIGMTTIKDEACFGIYADCEALPDADLLADCIEASVDELLAIADQRG